MSRFPLFFYSHFSFSILPTVRASFHFQLSDAHQIFLFVVSNDRHQMVPTPAWEARFAAAGSSKDCPKTAPCSVTSTDQLAAKLLLLVDVKKETLS
jgi:hypothetical protein